MINRLRYANHFIGVNRGIGELAAFRLTGRLRASKAPKEVAAVLAFFVCAAVVRPVAAVSVLFVKR